MVKGGLTTVRLEAICSSSIPRSASEQLRSKNADVMTQVTFNTPLTCCHAAVFHFDKDGAPRGSLRSRAWTNLSIKPGQTKGEAEAKRRSKEKAGGFSMSRRGLLRVVTRMRLRVKPPAEVLVG